MKIVRLRYGDRRRRTATCRDAAPSRRLRILKRQETRAVLVRVWLSVDLVTLRLPDGLRHTVKRAETVSSTVCAEEGRAGRAVLVGDRLVEWRSE